MFPTLIAKTTTILTFIGYFLLIIYIILWIISIVEAIQKNRLLWATFIFLIPLLAIVWQFIEKK